MSPSFLDAAASLRNKPDGHASVLVATVPADDELDEFARSLAPVVGEIRAKGGAVLRLVMSQGAVDRTTSPSPARRLCEDWGMDVVAASGRAVVVPGGTLFSPASGGAGGWWYFSPGQEARLLGPRFPVPEWDRHLARVAADIAEEHVVQAVPAGLLVQPAGVPLGTPDGIGFAVPVDTRRPQLLVGVPGAPSVSADALASILAALPGRTRQSVRLLPADGRDLLPIGQEVADALGLEVEISSGLPVLLEEDPESSRTLLLGADDVPAWEPYVESVVCAPAEAGAPPEVRMGAWRAPAPGLQESAQPGVFLLDDRWQTIPTWTGLWVGKQGDVPPLTARSTASDVVAVDLGVPGKGLDDSLWPALERLFGSLEESVRERAMIQVHGNIGADGLPKLRRLAVRHGMALAPKGWRSGTSESTLPLALAAPSESGTSAPPLRRPPASPAAEPIAPPVQYVTTTGGTGPAGLPVPQGPGPSTVPASGATAQESAGPREADIEPAPPASAVTAVAAAAQVPPQAPTHAPVPVPVPVTEPDVSSRAVPPEESPGTGMSEQSGPLPHPAEEGAGPPESRLMPPPPAAPWPPTAAFPPSSPPSEASEWPPPLPTSLGADAPMTEPEPFAPLFTSAGTDVEPEPLSSASTAGREQRPLTQEIPEHEEHPEERPEERPSTGLREITHVPIWPSHRSTAAERQLLRTHLGADWERHAGAVQRALTRLPGLRSGGHPEDELIADLTAVFAYLSTWGEGAGHRYPPASPGPEDVGALALLGCLSSGLRRLSSFRGAAVRPAGVFDEGTRMLLPGEEIGSAAPVAARGIDHGYPTMPDDHYLIWSSTGRRIAALTETGGADESDEVVFSPGTRLRVLGVRERAGATVFLLREIPEGAPPALPGQLDASDLPVLDRLTLLADQAPSPDGNRTWPAHVSGLLDVFLDVASGTPGA
ncbi:hypothetical protein ACWD3J_40015 [Streptomyces sp. NPDC002755]